MKNFVAAFLLGMVGIISGCGVYSFTGASISPEVKSFSVQYFPNRAQLVQPLLSQAFTEKLKERFISLANLRQADRDGDLQFEGYISDYRTAPVAIQGTETAALNRLTISVYVKFTNTKDAKQNFETTFTRYADYDAKKNLTEVELSLIDEINRQLIDDIFNKSVSNW
ncbi:MAG: LptE family protein [Bacteroidia bacterium]